MRYAVTYVVDVSDIGEASRRAQARLGTSQFIVVPELRGATQRLRALHEAPGVAANEEDRRG